MGKRGWIKMTIYKQYKNAKSELQTDIINLIEKFQKDTGSICTQLVIDFIVHQTQKTLIDNSIICNFELKTNIDL